MGGEETVGHAHRRQGRHPHHQRREPVAADAGEDDRHEEHEADAIEERDPDDKSGRRHRPRHPPLAAQGDEHLRNALRRPRLDDELAEHRAGDDHDRQIAKRCADPLPHRPGDVGWRHAESERGPGRDEDEGEEGMDLPPGHEEHKRKNRDGDDGWPH